MLKELLRKLGFELKRISKTDQSVFQIDNEEFNELVRDLYLYSEIDDSKWSDPKIVLSYLTPARISFYHAVLEKCSENSVIFDNKIIADFGVCTGYLLRLISKKFEPRKLFGYDNQKMFVQLSAHLVPEAKIFKHNLYHGLDEKFDIIFITEVLEHLTNPEKALIILYKMLNDNGIIIITVPDGRIDTSSAGVGTIEGDSFSGHINFWSIESFELFIRKMFGENQYLISKVNKSIFAIIKNNMESVLFHTL
jgi:SAM-dependent methyltransferase